MSVARPAGGRLRLGALCIGLACLGVLVTGCASSDELAVDAALISDQDAAFDERDREPLPVEADGMVDSDATLDAMSDAIPGSDGMTDAMPDVMPGSDAMTGSDALPDAVPEPMLDPADCDPLTVCGQSCADLSSDPHNCGGCGRTCVIPHAVEICNAGACAIAACDPGHFDADADPDNGCELESACLPDTDCATDCDTLGRQSCDDGIAFCAPPPEICNAIDDNCDGACDDGPLPGCRQAIHRSNGNGHLFTDDFAAAQANGYRLEAQAFFHLYVAEAPATRAVFLCQKPNGKHLLTTDTACEIGRAPLRTIGYWSPTPACASVPLFRVYQPASDNHFYTLSEPERNNAIANLGYRDEGIAGYVWRGP